ncbi:peptidylprolyl isomerase [Aliarcobacter thereius]|uniref:Peptidyl-prolyl cis-trans isomerase n=1 Tax=Aliarcobacter thereius TaxID=544718 RepID=A0A5R9H719_9BACT|nr:peptidylprolyl isomerase [Aliarcobacter thereius]OCL94002.1 Peptidyl-prolyl cis-trans isomerase B [Aliarcobacter thereius]TLS73080.1 peptidylprolyl isomerase [Aliarcobacter thereius]
MKKIIFLLIALFSFAIAKDPIAIFNTNLGEFKVELKPSLAPKAVENFIALSKKDYYNGTIFHRVIKGFMIQGGDPTGTGAGGESIWGENFEDEFSPNAIFDKPYILAMANRGKNTNGSQFFVTTVPTYWLNGNHSIFGYVIEGFETVKKIEAVKTAGRYGADKPLSDVVINNIKIEE